MRQSFLFNKVISLRPATFIQKETQTQVFSCEHCEILRATFFPEHL